MPTSSRNRLLLFAGIVVQILYSLPLASHDTATKVSGCELLSNPSKYNGKLVRVYGLVHSDYEHFDLRFGCNGYLQLETSTRETDVKRFGFKTKEDEKYRQLMKSIEDQGTIGKDCLECRPKRNVIHVTVEGFFRCHQDFPNCSNASRYGDSSLVIASIRSLRIERSELSNSPN